MIPIPKNTTISQGAQLSQNAVGLKRSEGASLLSNTSRNSSSPKPCVQSAVTINENEHSSVDLNQAQNLPPFYQNLPNRTALINFEASTITLNSALERLYFSSQSDFLNGTQAAISTSRDILKTNALGFNDFVSHLGMVRGSLASKSDPMKSCFGVRRTGSLRTGLIDERYFQLSKKMISNLLKHHLSSPLEIRKISRGIFYQGKFLPGCETASYDLYVNCFQPDRSKKALLTTKVAIIGSDFLIPHKNGVPLLDCEVKDQSDINKMCRMYSEMINRFGLLQANNLFYRVIHRFFEYGFKLNVVSQEFSHSNYETWEIIHTPPENVDALMAYAEEAFNNFLQLRSEDERLAFKEVARCLWLVANACPFKRGSSWVTEVMGSSMLSLLPSYTAVGGNLTRANIDFLAFGLPIDAFCKQFEDFLKSKG